MGWLEKKGLSVLKLAFPFLLLRYPLPGDPLQLFFIVHMRLTKRQSWKIPQMSRQKSLGLRKWFARSVRAVFPNMFFLEFLFNHELGTNSLVYLWDRCTQLWTIELWNLSPYQCVVLSPFWFRCPICHEVLGEALAPPCGHAACQPCNWVETEGQTVLVWSFCPGFFFNHEGFCPRHEAATSYFRFWENLLSGNLS